MTARPWMPLYVAEYMADTAHLGALESGAYLHLIFYYWQTGALPTENKQLARIAKVSARQWTKLVSVLKPFFYDGWKHKRVELELARVCEISEKRRNAVSARKDRRATNEHTSVEQKNTHLHLHLQRKKDGAPSAPLLESPSEESELYRRGKEVLGRSSGGMISKLLKSKNRNIALARAAIEQASTKQNPSEYIARVVQGAAGAKVDLADPKDVMRFILS